MFYGFDKHAKFRNFYKLCMLVILCQIIQTVRPSKVTTKLLNVWSKLCLFSKQTTGNMTHSKSTDMSIFVKKESYLKQDNYHFSYVIISSNGFTSSVLVVHFMVVHFTMVYTIYNGTESKLRISLKMSNCFAKNPLEISANPVLGKIFS